MAGPPSDQNKKPGSKPLSLTVPLKGHFTLTVTFPMWVLVLHEYPLTAHRGSLRFIAEWPVMGSPDAGPSSVSFNPHRYCLLGAYGLLTHTFPHTSASPLLSLYVSACVLSHFSRVRRCVTLWA